MNERPREFSALFDFIANNHFESVIDVGSNASTYIDALRQAGCSIIGVDINVENSVQKLDKFHQGNITELHLDPVDLVICLSVLEHSGITYESDEYYEVERVRVFTECVRLARKGVFFSFPFGEEMIIPGQYAHITDEELAQFINILEFHGFEPRWEKRLFDNEGGVKQIVILTGVKRES